MDHERQVSSTSCSSSYMCKNFNLEMTTRNYRNCLCYFFGDLLSNIPIMAPGAYINGKSNMQLEKLPISITVSSGVAEVNCLDLLFNAFTAKLYLRAWRACMSPISAP